MKPVRKIVASPYSAHGTSLKPGDYVWEVGRPTSGVSTVEVGELRLDVPSSLLRDLPVPAPIDQLLLLDPCFALASPNLDVVFSDDLRYYSVGRCPHGNLFLIDVAGGVASWSRLVFIGASALDEAELRDFWARHHHLTNDQLHLFQLGR